jgi:toxin ParE1/3/4
LRIAYKRRALADLDSISAYIARENPLAARRVVGRILQSLKRLEGFPYSGRAGTKPGTRELSVPGLPYLVIYRIFEERDDGIVEIVAVYHTARNRKTTDY